MSASSSTPARGFSTATLVVVGICWLSIMFEGFDLIVYGTVVPSLLQDPDWALTPAQAGAIGSYTLLGTLIGALAVGTITDMIGRRKALISCVAWFSLLMGLCAFAPTPEFLGLFRFLAGLGLGGLIPTVMALTSEYSPAGRSNFTFLTMMTGLPAGGIIAAGVSIPVIPAFGWQVMFLIGVLPLVVVVPLALKYLPESINFLLAKGRRAEAEALARRYRIPLEPETVSSVRREEDTAEHGGRFGPVRTLFSRGYLPATIAFWGACFMGLLLLYGLNTWLPQMMREVGHPLESALSFLLVFNVGGIVGLLITGIAADRFGNKPVAALSFVVLAASVALLSFDMPILAAYSFVGLVGMGVNGSQTVVSAFIARHYPASSRATALGWALSMGRFGAISGPLLGGFLVGSWLGIEWSFYAFAIPGLLGAAIILFVPKSPVNTPAGEVAPQQTAAKGPVAE